MKHAVSALVASSLLAIACSSPSSRGPVATSVEAISRAKSAWKSIHEKKRQRSVYSDESTAKFGPYTATLEDGLWHVRGTILSDYRGEMLETTVRERDGSVSVTVVQIK
jgi:hypothetical protein